MDDLHLISSPLSSERRLDVVFVHGLGGHPFSTWSSGEEGAASWPHWLAEEFGPQIGVWPLGYTTANPLQRLGVKQWFSRKPNPQGGAAMPLPIRAVNALERLAQAGIGQRPVCFIAHSLGGLLVKSILRRADATRDTPQWRKLIEHCRGVLFLATPHQGSVLADLVNVFRIILPTVNTDDLRDNDANLMELYYWYRDHAAGHNIRTLSYFEAKPCQAGVLVVKPSSADPGVSGPLARPPIPLDRDHLQISKPRDRSDLAYIGSKDLIERILAESSPAPTPSSTVVVRSFLASENDNAETVIDFTDLFVCANSRDRRPKHPHVWTQELPSRLAAAAATIECLPKPVILATLTHLSIAWHLGSLLHPKRGVPILLRQRSSASLDALWGQPGAAAGGRGNLDLRAAGPGGVRGSGPGGLRHAQRPSRCGTRHRRHGALRAGDSPCAAPQTRLSLHAGWWPCPLAGRHAHQHPAGGRGAEAPWPASPLPSLPGEPRLPSRPAGRRPGPHHRLRIRQQPPQPPLYARHGQLTVAIRQGLWLQAT